MFAPVTYDRHLPAQGNRRQQHRATHTGGLVEQQRRDQQCRHGMSVPDGITADQEADTETEGQRHRNIRRLGAQATSQNSTPKMITPAPIPICAVTISPRKKTAKVVDSSGPVARAIG